MNRFITILLFILLLPITAQAQCTNPAAEMGVLIMNKTHKVMQYCNGENWVGLWGSSGGNGGGLPTCTDGEIAQWQSGKWECKDGSEVFAYTETDPKVGTLTNGRWCRTDGSKVICDQTAPLSNYTETDPKVGTLTNGRWCTTNGSVINCTQTAPVLTESDPKVGALTNGRWCRSDGSQVICDQTAPTSAVTRSIVSATVSCTAGKDDSCSSSQTLICPANTVLVYCYNPTVVMSGTANCTPNFTTNRASLGVTCNAPSNATRTCTYTAQIVCLQ